MLEGRVRDSGAALTPDRLAHIFEPASGSAADAGMGLALSRHIVEAMHGAIVAENNAGAGATIAFNFVAEEAVLDLGETEQQQAARSAHVLVVDDNATNRMVAEALCEMFECTSESVEDGVEEAGASVIRRRISAGRRNATRCAGSRIATRLLFGKPYCVEESRCKTASSRLA